MRKLIVGLLMVGGLLAVAAPAPAIAQQGGIGDPLTLAASGVLIPFLSAGGDVSLLEVASPVSDNSGLHMFFFDQACNRSGDSVGLPATPNDIAFLQIPAVNLPVTTTAGLITIAQADDSGFLLKPLASPIHSRVYVYNTISGRSRVIEPIILDTWEFSSPEHWWSPLRTAATFFAPQETANVASRVLFVCPLETIQGGTKTSVGAFAVDLGFPPIDPKFADKSSAEALRLRIYDTDEVLRRDVRTPCACVREDSLLAISNFYGQPEAALGTYTEVEGNAVKVVTKAGNPNSDPPVPDETENRTISFTGYIATATVGSAVNNFVHRMSNGSKLSIQGGLSNTR